MVQNVKRIRLDAIGDERGYLLPLEIGRGAVPFEVKRVYYMYGIPEEMGRGKHAHLDLRQLLVCIHGGCTVRCDYGNRVVEEHRLDAPDQGLLIEGLVWREMFDFEPETVLLVLADEHYEDAAQKRFATMTCSWQR